LDSQHKKISTQQQGPPAIFAPGGPASLPVPAHVTRRWVYMFHLPHFFYNIYMRPKDFLLPVFFMNQFTPSPRVSPKDHFKFFLTFTEISQVKVHCTSINGINRCQICHRCQFDRKYKRHKHQICHLWQGHRRQVLLPGGHVIYDLHQVDSLGNI
jgi:hypothetical protein